MNSDPNRKIFILGAGITGLTTAWKLSEKYKDKVVLIEKDSRIGGLAGTIEKDNLRLDLGSHRIHPKYDAEALQLIQDLLGPDLLKRPRLGFILIKGKFLKYPPSIFDFFFKFGPRESILYFRDYVFAFLKRLLTRHWPEDFESYGILGVGRSLYNDFYAPYAQKLWGLPPNQISYEAALSRLRKFEMKAFVKELMNMIKKSKNLTYYLYPSKGIGQISEKLKERFLRNGGIIHLNSEVQQFNLKNDHTVESIDLKMPNGVLVTVPTEFVVSTIPIQTLHRLVKFPETGSPSAVFDLKTRSLRILYLVTNDKIPGENETFYLPDPHLLIGRVSEVKKYSPSMNDHTTASVLTIEIPCSTKDASWSMDDESLYKLCRKELVSVGIMHGEETPSEKYFSVKIENLYPIFEVGWRDKFNNVFNHLNSVRNLFMIGRPALFLHCNIDHCMVMALKLVDFLESGKDKKEWASISETFLKFQVKD